MTFCEALAQARDNAPTEEAKAAIQAVIDQHCGPVAEAGSGGTGRPPGG